ncbi:MAG: hypothetical protein ACJ8C4_13375 [Gemmataceae bacterium]
MSLGFILVIIAIAVVVAGGIALMLSWRAKGSRGYTPGETSAERAFVQGPRSSVLCCAMVGASIAGVMTFAVIFISSGGLGSGADIQAWAGFASLMGGLGAALLGLVLGGIYGALRVPRTTDQSPK